ncbi:MAG: type II toxin-antitoxin system RelE/ParE family toxin [bacterium]|nr:type II toxin-antitoxin system RelE/ParE family toxin [bacterium]MBK7189521.1 type II toxin-antitoxin system RelE/ParE family toxin [bacterium]
MTRSFEVHWAAVAENDLLGIILYVADDSPGTALKVLTRIRNRTARLKQSPLQGRIVPELLRQGISQYREVVVAPWRVIYRVEGRRVLVLSVIDSRRNVEDVLLGRLLQ